MTDLKLDRIAIEEVGGNPVKLAAAIHQQLGDRPGSVPVYEIASALDILEIREERLTNIEGALITPPARGYGSILVNSNSRPPRRRFTVAHELLHFLSSYHHPVSQDGFFCSRQDLISSDQKSADRHQRQEAEANAFAIELLAPLKRVRGYLRGPPDLHAVVAMADELAISREAAARRFVSSHREPLAAVFSHNGRVVYREPSRAFPRLSISRGQQLTLARSLADDRLSEMEEANPEDWLDISQGVAMSAQTLWQADGYAITLLHVVHTAEDDEEDRSGIDDSYDRLSRSGSGK